MEPEQQHRPSADDPRHRTPDSLQQSELEDLWSKYKLLFIGIPLLIILGVGGWMWWEIQQDRLRTEARQALSVAESQAELRAVAEDYSGTVLGGEALLLLSRKQHEEGDLTAASETLMRFTEKYPRHPLIAGAWFALAGISGELGDQVRALDLYRRIRTEYEDSYVAELAIEAEARLLAEQGKLSEGVTLMEQRLQGLDEGDEAVRQNIEFQIAMLKRVKEPLSEIPDPEPEPVPGPTDPTIPGAEGMQIIPQLDNPLLDETPFQPGQIDNLGSDPFSTDEEGLDLGNTTLDLNPDAADEQADAESAAEDPEAQMPPAESSPAETETEESAGN